MQESTLVKRDINLLTWTMTIWNIQKKRMIKPGRILRDTQRKSKKSGKEVQFLAILSVFTIKNIKNN